jgi:hypothetical protein
VFRPWRKLIGQLHKLRMGSNSKPCNEPLPLQANLTISASDFASDPVVCLPFGQAPKKLFFALA